MSQYQKYADGSAPLSVTENKIRAEEAGASAFVEIDVVTPDGKPKTNLVTFDELPPGQLPNQFFLRKSTEPAPAQSTQIWAGTVIANSSPTLAIAYREL